jgi:hypothetical protein
MEPSRLAVARPLDWHGMARLPIAKGWLQSSERTWESVNGLICQMQSSPIGRPALAAKRCCPATPVLVRFPRCLLRWVGSAANAGCAIALAQTLSLRNPVEPVCPIPGFWKAARRAGRYHAPVNQHHETSTPGCWSQSQRARPPRARRWWLALDQSGRPLSLGADVKRQIASRYRSRTTAFR